MTEEIWDAGDCADYFGVSRKHFLREVRYREGFPPQLPWSIGHRPRWAAQAVKDYAIGTPQQPKSLIPA